MSGFRGPTVCAVTPDELRDAYDDQLRTDDGSFQDGFTPWIVKLRYPQDGPDAAAVEFAYHQLARHAGIRVPAARLLTTPSDRFFAVERFDRAAGTRIHMLSLSGLLDLPQIYFAAEYGEVGRLIASLCESYAETTEFARRMVFSVLAHNRDDHLKNTALLMNADGTWRLAPAYDLTFMRGPGGEHSMLVAGEGRPCFRSVREDLLWRPPDSEQSHWILGRTLDGEDHQGGERLCRHACGGHATTQSRVGRVTTVVRYLRERVTITIP